MNRDPARLIALVYGLIVGAVIMGAVHHVNATPMPPLVGRDCQGASGPLFAFEESDFPICQTIEARR